MSLDELSSETSTSREEAIATHKSVVMFGVSARLAERSLRRIRATLAERARSRLRNLPSTDSGTYDIEEESDESCGLRERDRDIIGALGAAAAVNWSGKGEGGPLAEDTYSVSGAR